MLICCKKCGSDKHHLAGKINGKQRYKCTVCYSHYVMQDGRKRYNDTQKLHALLLFRKGLSLRSIADIIGTNNVTVLKWIRGFGATLKAHILSQPIEKTEELDVIEIDELWHYVKKNSKNYGSGLLILVPKDGLSQSKLVLVGLSP